MTHKPHIFRHPLAHKLNRSLASLRAPAKAMLCTLLAVCLMFFSSTLCCCLMTMPATGQQTNAALLTQATLAPAMLMTSADHSCCTKQGTQDNTTDHPSSFQNKTSSQNNTPQRSASCTCNGKVIDAPSHPITIHSIAAVTSFDVFTLPRLTATWQLPVLAGPTALPDTLAPPIRKASTLLAQDCLLTV